MPAWKAGQSLGRQGGGSSAIGRRRQRQHGHHRRIAAVDMNFEFTLRAACAADPNLRQIRADLKPIEAAGRR